MSKVRAPRKDSVTSVDSNISMESNATFDAEMDNFLEELMNKKKSADNFSKVSTILLCSNAIRYYRSQIDVFRLLYI